MSRAPCLPSGARQKRFELPANGLRKSSLYEQAGGDEVDVAVARATDMSRAEMLATIFALEQRAEESRTSHQATLLDEMSGVAGDALEIQ